ncbi:MAG: hypothetical protein ACLQG5_07930 [Methanobacterium sp.]|jgi:hypothetical protein
MQEIVTPQMVITPLKTCQCKCNCYNDGIVVGIAESAWSTTVESL